MTSLTVDQATLDMVVRWLERWAENTELTSHGELGAMFAGAKAAAFREAAEVLRNRPQVLTKHEESPAIIDVIAERKRQITAEGWSPQHDDAHDCRELARAAGCYLQHFIGRQWVIDGYPGGLEAYQEEPASDDWPWVDKWWKPKDPRRDLVRAAALIIAEIERLDRCKPLRNETPEELDEDGMR